MEYNIYCDESCHLENDHQKAMVLGAIWCEKSKVKDMSEKLRLIKSTNNLSKTFEVKWTKVSPAKVDFYRELINFFFAENCLGFRALIVPDKSILRHADFDQTHDDWYYKMYFDMLKAIITPDSNYWIYLDIKDTRGAEKVKNLHDVLCNNSLDFNKKIIKRVQQVHSCEIELLQLADLLLGAVSYVNREAAGSTAKLSLIDLIKKQTGYSLNKSTLLRETKFNLFRWHSAKRNNNHVS
jgi:hypothetical protein